MKTPMCRLLCEARTETSELRPCSVRLSVRQSCWWLPCCSRTYVIAKFTFQRDAWKQTFSGEWQNQAFVSKVNIKKLRRLDLDQKIWVKCYTEQRTTKTCLEDTLGGLVDALVSGIIPVTLQVVHTAKGVQVLWPSPVLSVEFAVTEEDEQDCTESSGSSMEQQEFEDAAPEPSAVVNNTSTTVTEGVSEPILGPDTWATFGSTSSGKFVSLPAQDDERKGLAGVWTKEDDDLLDEKAMEILADIVPRPNTWTNTLQHHTTTVGMPQTPYKLQQEHNNPCPTPSTFAPVTSQRPRFPSCKLFVGSPARVSVRRRKSVAKEKHQRVFLPPVSLVPEHDMRFSSTDVLLLLAFLAMAVWMVGPEPWNLWLQ